MAELGVFAKYWAPGKVKTRLAARLGADLAADVYRILLQHLVGQLTRLSIRRTLVFSPAESLEAFSRVFPVDWHFAPQATGDLGERLSHFAKQALARDAEQKVILIGSDTPRLGPDQIQQAVEELDRFPVVLGPTADGGYYLIGLRRVGTVFDRIPWSTPEVWNATLQRLQTERLPYHALAPMNDVDDAEDLDQLIQELTDSMNPADRRLLTDLLTLLKRETQ